MDYYHGNSPYYQGGDMMNSPQQHQQQQYYYPYKGNYRRPQQRRYSSSNHSSRSRRHDNRVHNMGDPSYYYNNDEELPSNPYSPNYHDRPLNRRSMYYKNEDDDYSSYCTASEYNSQQLYDEEVYNSPIKSSGRRLSNNTQKSHDYPITPEEGRRFSYPNKEDDNISYGYPDDNVNNTGTITLTSAYNQYNAEDVYHGDEEEDEEEEEEEDPTTQMNTKFNAESNVMINSNHGSPHSITASSTIINSPQQQQQQQPSMNPDQQQQQAVLPKSTWFKNVVSMTALVFKRKVKQFRKRDSMTQESPVMLHGEQTQPAIQFITATNNELLGDVLDAQQEKEILSQLSTPNLSTTTFNMSPEKTKITNLDRIWVFRLIDPNQPPPDANATSVAWIGFDYENQIAIENHLTQASTLPKDEQLVVFYDSHIRYGKMPVIVTPGENKGYYFANEEQTDLIMLQVTFIENNHNKVTFVYRV